MELQEPWLCASGFKSLHVITFLLLIFNFLLPTTIATSFGNETDRFALLKFQESIITDPQGLLNSWNDFIHFCSWQGITCSKRHQRVTALDLFGHGLNGTISPYIGNLSFLRSIGHTENNLYGKIPLQLTHLHRLRYLELSLNMLEGEIPANLTSLPELSARDKLMVKPSNWHNSTEPWLVVKLTYLFLDGNNLTGGIPASLGNLTSMTKLDLGDDNLVGSIPEEMGRLRTLGTLYLDLNNLSGIIPSSLFNISSMENLVLINNNFKGNIPTAIGLNMPRLLVMHVGANVLAYD